MKSCVFAGTFDPVTIGHIDIIERATKLFDKVHVGILINNKKLTMFSSQDRLLMLQKSLMNIKNVEVDYFDGLLVDFCKKKNTTVIVRGLRNATDYEYEMLQSHVNYTLYDKLEFVYLPTKLNYLHVSSSIVRELIRYNGDISGYVPEDIIADIRKLEKKI